MPDWRSIYAVSPIATQGDEIRSPYDAVAFVAWHSVGLWFGYPAIPTFVLESWPASHTLLGTPIVQELASRLDTL
jgi:hypothetical protein